MYENSQGDLSSAYSDSSDFLYTHTNPHNVGGSISSLLSVTHQGQGNLSKSSMQGGGEDELSSFFTVVQDNSCLHTPLQTHHHMDQYSEYVFFIAKFKYILLKYFSGMFSAIVLYVRPSVRPVSR